jgi:hypothetical protein
MAVAAAHYAAEGFVVEDTSSRRPFDLLCRRGDQEVRVEVKGTRSDGAEVFVTTAEVLNARGDRWRTDLFVLSRVVVTRSDVAEPSASGGAPNIIAGWVPQEQDLIPTQYRYLVPVMTEDEGPPKT